VEIFIRSGHPSLVFGLDDQNAAGDLPVTQPSEDTLPVTLPSASWSLTFSCQEMPDIWSRKLRGPSVAGRP
jgi:hypothetical protein